VAEETALLKGAGVDKSKSEEDVSGAIGPLRNDVLRIGGALEGGTTGSRVEARRFGRGGNPT